MLAKLLRAGKLISVCVPASAYEAVCDLVRARAITTRVLGKARQHLHGLLLWHDRIHPGKKVWSVAYLGCLTTVRLQHSAQPIVFQNYVNQSSTANTLQRLCTGTTPTRSKWRPQSIGSIVMLTPQRGGSRTLRVSREWSQ